MGKHTCAVKETDELIARREYHLLRDLQRLDLPYVVPQAVVTGRKDRNGEWLPCALVTRHLRYSLPYRSLFSHGMRADSLPLLVDALVVLLVRLHLAGFYWGDVSLSNVLFRRSAGEFAAYLVDAETGELHAQLSDSSGGTTSPSAGRTSTPSSWTSRRRACSRTSSTRSRSSTSSASGTTTCGSAHETAEFEADEQWRISQWVESLNALGFDIDEMDIRGGGGTRVGPPAAGRRGRSPRRELRSFTGLDVEEGQARRMLTDIARFSAHHGLGERPREVAATQWLQQIYEPLVRSIPRELRGRLEPAEVFHEVLEHRWFLSERAGHEVDIFDAARDYIEKVLTSKPVEALSTDEEDLDLGIRGAGFGVAAAPRRPTAGG